MPFLVRLHTEHCQACDFLQDSISHYYYTFGNVWFIGILWGLGLSLIFYPTPDPDKPYYFFGKRKVPGRFRKLDGSLTSIAGVLAICVTLFPTNDNSTDSCSLFHLHNSGWRSAVHYISAAGMLLIFSVMSVFFFPRTADPDLKSARWIDKPWKKTRNLLYVACGVATFISIAVIGIMALLKLDIHPKSTYWLEVGALVPFGISWLIKGGFILTDPRNPSTVRHATSVITRLRKATPNEDWFKKAPPQE